MNLNSIHTFQLSSRVRFKKIMNTNDPFLRAKINAAKVGAGYVESGMVIGLGSGSTAELLVAELASRLNNESLKFCAVATSERTEMLAIKAGIKIIEPDKVKKLDLVIDGADEVDPQFRMIKGRGGALLREKIVASAADVRIILIDQSKHVLKLGNKHRLPVEISTFGCKWTNERIAYFGIKHQLRMRTETEPFLTDGSNFIVDLETGPIDDVEKLQAGLLSIPGVFETGLFIDLCDVLITGDDHSAKIINKKG